MKTLYDIAKVLRSKNSGPFEITLDVIFGNEADFEAVKKARLISRERIAELYHLPVSWVQEPVYFDAALGIKVTYARAVSSGTVGERDVYGAQQHGALGGIVVEG